MQANIDKIKEFLIDIDCLRPLTKWSGDINFFEISGMVRKEIKHSKLLAWLLDSNANHGLGDAIILKFLQKVLIYNQHKELDLIDISLLDYYSFTIKTESFHNIDIFLISEDEKTIIAIENKIDNGERISGDDGGQLPKYLTAINKEYQNYKKLLIFLTPDGDTPSDSDNWSIANYDMIVNAINETINDIQLIKDDTKVILLHYIKMIRRHIIMDKELQDICKKIYYKHRDALDLIYQNRPDSVQEISDFILSYLYEIKNEKKLTVYDGSKTYRRFSTEYIDEILPTTTDTNYGWGIGRRLLYEFELGEGGVSLHAEIINRKTQNDEIVKKILELNGGKDTNWVRISNCKMQLLNKDDINNWDDSEGKDKIKNKIITNINKFISEKIPVYESLIKGKLKGEY